jgi:hypothetical protein
LKPRRLLAALVLAVLAALALALPASSAAPAQEEQDTCPPPDEVPLTSLRARLTGAEVVPAPGDPDARGRATVDVFSGKVSYSLRFEGIGEPPGANEPATAAHIHFGDPGRSGPVVITLFGLPDEQAAVASLSSICVDVPPVVSLLLDADPGAFYVDVHSESFPDGAIRGQLRERTLPGP